MPYYKYYFSNIPENSCFKFFTKISILRRFKRVYKYLYVRYENDKTMNYVYYYSDKKGKIYTTNKNRKLTLI